MIQKTGAENERIMFPLAAGTAGTTELRNFCAVAVGPPHMLSVWVSRCTAAHCRSFAWHFSSQDTEIQY